MIRDKQLLVVICHVQRGLNSSGLNLEQIDYAFLLQFFKSHIRKN